MGLLKVAYYLFLLGVYGYLFVQLQKLENQDEGVIFKASQNIFNQKKNIDEVTENAVKLLRYILYLFFFTAISFSFVGIV